ncbi:hypothetical protein QUF99_24045 [Bacillus sp. DX4.1]|uniref:hypothetical protein n=1 Tax=Bacillus sp. DX4.1 TaxID=3055867 RepID=UPI00259FFCD5|nr:hypothetical protein [Bacillus sp. DX4.1]MDM5190301.1 hypothetical protein [Bacillus sp. DX4.1]
MGRKSNRKKRKKQGYTGSDKNGNIVVKKKPRSKLVNGLIDAASIIYFVTGICIFVYLGNLEVPSVSLHIMMIVVFILIAIALYVLVFVELLSSGRDEGSSKRKKGSSYSSSGFMDYSSNDCSSSSDGGDCGGGGD